LIEILSNANVYVIYVTLVHTLKLIVLRSAWVWHSKLWIYLCTPCDIGAYFENRFFKKDFGDGIMAFHLNDVDKHGHHWNDWVQ
jgi:hypothetical protein